MIGTGSLIGTVVVTVPSTTIPFATFVSPLLGDGVRIICTPPDVLEVTVLALFFDVDEAVELVRPAFEFDRTALPLEDAFLLLLLLWLPPPLT